MWQVFVVLNNTLIITCFMFHPIGQSHDSTDLDNMRLNIQLVIHCVLCKSRLNVKLYKYVTTTWHISFWNRVHKDPSESSKVVDFGTTRNGVWDFLLVLNSNLGPILPRSIDIRGFICQKPLFPYCTRHPYSGLDFGVFLLGSSDRWRLRLISREIIFKYYNLCDNDTWTSQTDDLP